MVSVRDRVGVRVSIILAKHSAANGTHTVPYR